MELIIFQMYSSIHYFKNSHKSSHKLSFIFQNRSQKWSQWSIICNLVSHKYGHKKLWSQCQYKYFLNIPESVTNTVIRIAQFQQNRPQNQSQHKVVTIAVINYTIYLSHKISHNSNSVTSMTKFLTTKIVRKSVWTKGCHKFGHK